MENKLHYWQKFLIWMLITGILSSIAFFLTVQNDLSLLLMAFAIISGIPLIFYLAMALIEIILILKDKLTQRKRIKTGKQKGFLRITLVSSFLASIIAEIWYCNSRYHHLSDPEGIYLAVICFISVWILYGAIKWIIAGFKTSQ